MITYTKYFCLNQTRFMSWKGSDVWKICDGIKEGISVFVLVELVDEPGKTV